MGWHKWRVSPLLELAVAQHQEDPAPIHADGHCLSAQSETDQDAGSQVCRYAQMLWTFPYKMPMNPQAVGG